VQLLQSIFIGWIILLSRVKADYSRARLQASCRPSVHPDRRCRHPINLPERSRNMKPATIIGIVLVVLGIIGFATGGISFTHKKKVADLGSVQISRTTQDTLPLSPIFSTVSLVVGLGLIVAGARLK
jgi:hypothetical protein